MFGLLYHVSKVLGKRPLLMHCFLQWALVIAGISDFSRPPEKLSLTQNAALMATGAIWTRWCLIIKPRNVLYALPPWYCS